MSCCRLVLVLYLVVAAFAFSHINAAHSADNPNRHIQQVQDIENINAQTLFQTLAMSARVKLQKISPYSNQIAGIIFAFGASGSGIVLVIAGSESDVKWNQYMGPGTGLLILSIVVAALSVWELQKKCRRAQ